MNDTTPGLPLLQVHDGRATLTLNRPAHHNRLHVEDLQALGCHFEALANRADVQVLVLTGTGASFCSGFDIGSIDGGAASSNAGPRLFEQTVDALEALPLPTVCRLNGSVYGGATDLALACDFRIGVDDMTLRIPAVRLGLHYYPSGLRRFVSRLGLGAAKRLFLLAESIAAGELLRLGCLDRCVHASRLDDELQSVVDALLAGAPLALRGMKASLNEIARGEFEPDVLGEREARCAASDDLREGKAAFAERRMARFRGR
ncbi:MAG: enoyl-CoA hydratase/isomerase family protein [Ideonella sp.]|nr:enoyl-CoA hydratase/isomerase family protein [Ideonella sp.]